MLVFLAAFLVWPRKYSSEGKVYVQLGRIATEISPTTGSQSISVQDTRESEVLSVVEIIRSRGVTEAVVDEVGAKRILASPLDKFIPKISLPKFSSSSKDGLSAKEYKRLKQRERAAKKLSLIHI